MGIFLWLHGSQPEELGGFNLARQLVLVISNILGPEESEELLTQSYATCQPRAAPSKEFWEVSWG